MKELLKNQKLVLQHVPGNGAWTYHLVIPGTKDLHGKWGDLKVSGTIDGYGFKNMNLAPVTGQDKRMSVNGDIRKAICKGGGDEVVVTMHKDSDSKLTKDTEVYDCFKNVDVYQKFKYLPDEEQQRIVKDILSQQSEQSQEKKILSYIKKSICPKIT